MITESTFSQQKEIFLLVKARVKELVKTKKIPDAVMQEIEKLNEFLNNYDIEQHNQTPKIKLTGDFLSPEKIKEFIIDASGYNKWTVEENSDGYDSKFFKQHFNIEVDEIKNYHISRSSNSRNDLWLVKACVLPGHIFLAFDTGRVGWSSDGVIENDKAYEEIQKQMDTV